MHRNRLMALSAVAVLLAGCGTSSHAVAEHPRHHVPPAPVVIPASAGLTPIHYSRATDSAWKTLSDRVGFTVLYPQEGAQARLIRTSVSPTGTPTVLLQFNNFVIEESKTPLSPVAGPVKTTGAVAIAIPKAGIPYPIPGTWYVVDIQGHPYSYLGFAARGIHVVMMPSGQSSLVTLTQLSWIAETLTNRGS